MYRQSSLSMIKMILILVLCLLVQVSSQSSYDWDVRLAGGPHGYEGRLEMRNPPNGLWGTVCDKNTTQFELACSNSEAYSMCVSLGYFYEYSLSLAGQRFGSVDLPIWSQGFRCQERDWRPLIKCPMDGWTREPSSCDHSFDVALLCLSDHIRLADGCSPREGRVEISLGSMGWARLTRPQQTQPSFVEDLHEADLICKHLGYPMAIGANGTCTKEPADPAFPAIEADICRNAPTLSTCLKSQLLPRRVCETGKLSGDGRLRELVCAYDDELIDNATANCLYFDARLTGGPSRLVGLAAVQFNASGWRPVCVYTGGQTPLVNQLARKICTRLGSSCTFESTLVSPDDDPGRGVECFQRFSFENDAHWLRLNNKCSQLDGSYLSIPCSLGFYSF